MLQPMGTHAMTNTNEARIESSTVCNYACSFCPHSDLTRSKDFMSMDLYRTIIDKLPSEIEVVTLSGLGEMFLDPNIFAKIIYAKNRGYTVNALTNGSMFVGSKLEELRVSGIDSVRLSIHASTFDLYKSITGCSSVRDFNNKEYLIDYLQATDIEVIVTMDVTDENIHDVDNVILKYRERVDLLEIWKVHNWGKWGSYRDGEQAKMTCGRPFDGPLQIQVDGTINMCCFDYDGTLLLGDLKTQTIEEIFNSASLDTIKKFHLGETVEEDILCKHCDQLYAKDEGILIYNSKFGKERIGTLSTTYKEMNDR